MLAIFKREVKAYFNSPIAYILIGFFILLSSIFFLSNINIGYGMFTGNLSMMGFVLIFIVPILTMRVLAEDRKNGTEVLLITSPNSVSSIVLGKFFASTFVFLVMTVITVVYPVILSFYGKLSMPRLIGGYIGFFLLGAAFIAVGVFASSLTENQVVAAVISFVSILIMWLMSNVASFTGGLLAEILDWFSLLSRYENFNAGILDLGPIVYYLSFTAIFVFFAVMVIERRRWSQG